MDNGAQYAHADNGFDPFKTKNLDRLHWSIVGLPQKAICFETVCVDLTPAS